MTIVLQIVFRRCHRRCASLTRAKSWSPDGFDESWRLTGEFSRKFIVQSSFIFSVWINIIGVFDTHLKQGICLLAGSWRYRWTWIPGRFSPLHHKFSNCILARSTSSSLLITMNVSIVNNVPPLKKFSDGKTVVNSKDLHPLLGSIFLWKMISGSRVGSPLMPVHINIRISETQIWNVQIV